MSAISDNKYDIHIWIKQVIDSCVTRKQLRTADKLVDAFYNTYNDWILFGELRRLTSDQYDIITNK